MAGKGSKEIICELRFGIIYRKSTNPSKYTGMFKTRLRIPEVARWHAQSWARCTGTQSKLMFNNKLMQWFPFEWGALDRKPLTFFSSKENPKRILNLRVFGFKLALDST